MEAIVAYRTIIPSSSFVIDNFYYIILSVFKKNIVVVGFPRSESGDPNLLNLYTSEEEGVYSSILY